MIVDQWLNRVERGNKKGTQNELCPLYEDQFVLGNNVFIVTRNINPLAPEFPFKNLAHPVFIMWIIQEPKKVALWNKRYFEEEKTENLQHV